MASPAVRTKRRCFATADQIAQKVEIPLDSGADAANGLQFGWTVFDYAQDLCPLRDGVGNLLTLT